VPSPNPSSFPFLTGVTVTSASSAWAVGSYTIGTAGQTLILQWNGTKWTHVPSPNPVPSDELVGVAASSGSNAWAVGTSTNDSQAIAIHCC